MRARYYNPNLKIFMSRDPFPGWQTVPASQHGYSYVHNNPVNLTDPSGEAPHLIVAAAACAANPLCVIGVGGVVVIGAAWVVVGPQVADLLAPIFTNMSYDVERAVGHIARDVRTRLAECEPIVRPAFQQRSSRTQTNPRPISVDLLPGPQFPRPNHSSNRTIVELGAGDYSNAIAMKRTHPRDRVIATNLIEDWEAGRWFHEAGYSQNDFHQIGFYLGWVEAQKWGVEVGTPMPYENAQVPSGIGDLVYTILPYPTFSAEQFGRDAARIAKQQPGTVVAITSGAGSAHKNFIRGFNQERGGSIFVPIAGAIYGEPGVGWEDGPYTTWVYQIP